MPFYRSLLRPLLFRLDPEQAHTLTVETARFVGAVPGAARLLQSRLSFTAPELETTVAGLRFGNPLGLAAGWDKSGRALTLLDRLGFGFAEIGSVSAVPSSGNPRPRLFRLTADRAIVVNYGLPNDGAETVAKRVAARQFRVPLGVNIVATNFGSAAPARPTDDILADYQRSAALLHRHADYLSLNLSCPNAKEGQNLFAVPGMIAELLTRLADLEIACPVFLKLPPDFSPAVQDRWLEEVSPSAFIRGFQFNLPPGKPADLTLQTPREVWAKMPGAVSGQPAAALADRCIAALSRQIDRRQHVIIGGGGVFTADDAYRKIRLGASLVQIYTALIYEGPGVIRRINSGLAERLRRDGFRHVAEAVGIDA